MGYDFRYRSRQIVYRGEGRGGSRPCKMRLHNVHSTPQVLSRIGPLRSVSVPPAEVDEGHHHSRGPDRVSSTGPVSTRFFVTDLLKEDRRRRTWRGFSRAPVRTNRRENVLRVPSSVSWLWRSRRSTLDGGTSLDFSPKTLLRFFMSCPHSHLRGLSPFGVNFNTEIKSKVSMYR